MVVVIVRKGLFLDAFKLNRTLEAHHKIASFDVPSMQRWKINIGSIGHNHCIGGQGGYFATVESWGLPSVIRTYTGKHPSWSSSV